MSPGFLGFDSLANRKDDQFLFAWWMLSNSMVERWSCLSGMAFGLRSVQNGRAIACGHS